jgi:hypothetical protein
MVGRRGSIGKLLCGREFGKAWSAGLETEEDWSQVVLGRLLGAGRIC